jgi:hypothetical protein
MLCARINDFAKAKNTDDWVNVYQAYMDCELFLRHRELEREVVSDHRDTHTKQIKTIPGSAVNAVTLNMKSLNMSFTNHEQGDAMPDYDMSIHTNPRAEA